MTVHRNIDGLGGIPGPVHCAIGVFDGVHLGHQAVIGEAMASAREGGGTACVITFDPHPARVLAPASAPRLLTSTPHKLRLLEDLGIAHVVVITFDREFAEMPAEAFVRGLNGSAGDLARICVGSDWRFGNRCTGNVELLERLGSDLGFAVTGVPTVRVDGMVASSTRIREAVAGGDFSVAERLLGRPYTVLGTVVEGRRLGRTLGFPTANLRVHNEQLPPTGVYAVRIRRGTGAEWAGVGNLGYRPTLEGDEMRRTLEVHAFDFSGDLYGEDLEVRFLSFLRPERKFENLEALKRQIETDAAAARAVADGV
jgi:riboflavin kinase/FMN adenylyltransferase